MAASAGAGDTPMPDADEIRVDATNGDNDGEEQSKLSHDLYEAMITMLERLYDYRDETGHDPSKVFHKRPNKRNYPEYYDMIENPMAMSNLKASINSQKYTRFTDFVRDCALIWHNAFTFNRPESIAYEDATAIKAVMEAELKKIVDQDLVSAEDAKWPDLGEIPPVDEDEMDDDDDADSGQDEDEYGLDNSDTEGDASRSRGRRPSGPRRGDSQIDGSNKRRGRPPKKLTPLEGRIRSVIKSLKQLKHDNGVPMIADFEKLPDKVQFPEYYTVIQEPLSLEQIKKYSKRNRYRSVEDCLQQLDHLFENAKVFNEEDSPIYNAAVQLKALAHQTAAKDKHRPDSEFSDEKVKPQGVQHNGQLWKIGDWVHIQNPNDTTKPIVAQIYKIWEDENGKDWVNTCWYYRPEQTVHHYEKHFWPNEVFKSSRYSDHPIDELIDKCFVMFFTRYNKGRPVNLPQGTEVYVCEARYNENKHTMNKIKTWSSCLPNEVRDHDYEMTLYDVPKRIKKLPTPLQHLIKDAKDPAHAPLPQPKMGSDEAPPIEGGVYLGARDENQSPPPSPTSSPAPVPQQSVSQSSSTPARASPSKAVYQGGSNTTGLSTQRSMPAGAAASISLARPASSGASHTSQYTQTPQHPITQALQFQNTRPTFEGYGTPSTHRQTPSQPMVRPIGAQGVTSAFGPVRLPDHVNNAIHPHVRALHHTDDDGHVLFWAEPNVPERTEKSDSTDDGGHRIPSHLRTSLRYRAAKLREKLSKHKENERATENKDAMQVDPHLAKDVVPSESRLDTSLGSGGLSDRRTGQASPVKFITDQELLCCEPEDILKLDSRRVPPVLEQWAQTNLGKSFLQFAYQMQLGTRKLYESACDDSSQWKDYALQHTNEAIRLTCSSLEEAQAVSSRLAAAKRKRVLDEGTVFDDPKFYIEDIDPSYVGTRWMSSST